MMMSYATEKSKAGMECGEAQLSVGFTPSTPSLWTFGISFLDRFVDNICCPPRAKTPHIEIRQIKHVYLLSALFLLDRSHFDMSQEALLPLSAGQRGIGDKCSARATNVMLVSRGRGRKYHGVDSCSLPIEQSS